MRTGRASTRTGTYVLERGVRVRHGVMVVVIRRGIGVRARRHAILEVGRVRLRDDVQRARGMLALVLVHTRRRVGRGVAGCGGLVRVGWGLGVERGVLEGGEGGVEGAAEGLGERAGVLGGGGGYCCEGSGHVMCLSLEN